jgi:hypothetical protein
METVKAASDTIACTLTDDEKRARREELRVGVLGLITTARESVETVREFVVFESRCCSFMTYTIDDRDDGVTWLRLSGPEGAKTFIRSWLPEKILEIIDGRAV